MWLNAIARRFHGRLIVVVLLVLGAAIQVGCGDRETTLVLVIEKPTEVLSIEQAPSSSESADKSFLPGKVIATLKAGETIRAVGVYHGKDYDAFKVELANGAEGLVVAGDTFKAVSH